MKLNEIITAVKNGLTVHWSNPGYIVTKDNRNEYFITCTSNGHSIGLTWEDGTTLNGQENDFYTSVRQLTYTLDTDTLPEELNDLITCLPFWNKEGSKCYLMNCEEDNGRKLQTYESWILRMMLSDCKAMLHGRAHPLPYTFDKSGDHIWLHNEKNERILMFHFPAMQAGQVQ